MERAKGRDRGQHRADSLDRRPPEGAAQVRAHLEYRGHHRAPGPGWITDRALLRRVRDALAARP